MSLLLYVLVLLISASSVVLGFGWLSAPQPHYNVPTPQVASNAPSNLTTAPKDEGRANPPQLSDIKAVEASQAAPPKAAVSVPASTEKTEVVTTPASNPELPACDIQACTAAHPSFRASDCTYKTYRGPRRLCTRGTPRVADQEEKAEAALAQAPTCNITACAAAYRSFDPVDCTYQPYEGPRRICEK
jgi:hypothetical protein